MRHTDLHTGAGRLRDSLKTLRAHWHIVGEQWNDVVRQEFEKNYFEIIETQTLGVIDAAGRLAEVINRAEHECS